VSAPTPGLEPAAVPTARYGEVFDRGYQHYDGPRYGRGYAIWALVRYSMKRALGFKKGWGAKIIPILLYLGVILPVVISIGIRAFLPNVNVLDYAEYFAFIFVIEGIFVATIAPEMLCGDRRENVLALYFSRAITRADYLLAKLLATAILTLTVSCVPAVILWLGRQLLDDSPLSAMRDNVGDLGRILLTGVVIAFYLGAIGLMISSFTGRKSIAVAIIVFGFLIAEAIAGSLAVAVSGESDYARYIDFLSPTLTVGSFVARLFEGATSDNDLSIGLTGIVIAVVIALCCAVMYWRYVPND